MKYEKSATVFRLVKWNLLSVYRSGVWLATQTTNESRLDRSSHGRTTNALVYVGVPKVAIGFCYSSSQQHPYRPLSTHHINSALIFRPTLVEKLLVYVNITLKALMLDSPVTLIEWMSVLLPAFPRALYPRLSYQCRFSDLAHSARPLILRATRTRAPWFLIKVAAQIKNPFISIFHVHLVISGVEWYDDDVSSRLRWNLLYLLWFSHPSSFSSLLYPGIISDFLFKDQWVDGWYHAQKKLALWTEVVLGWWCKVSQIYISQKG